MEYMETAFGGTTSKDEINTPILDMCARNLTEMARNGELDVVLCRDEEIDRISQILCRRKKNNPILIGEAGVGKTAVVEGLAQAIVDKQTSPYLFNKEIFSIELSALVAGTKYRGEFEERLQTLLKEITTDKNKIIFIDEIHTMVGAGNASGSLDAANILKPALARGEVQCIGSTTLDEYREHIETDNALVRRFQPIHIDQPSPDETILILDKLKAPYEEHHKVTYSKDVIHKIVQLSERYIVDRYFPDKAIDVMDEVGSKKHIKVKSPSEIKKMEKELVDIMQQQQEAVAKQNYLEAAKYIKNRDDLKIRIKEINDNWLKTLNEKSSKIQISDVEDIISQITGIPVQKIGADENQRLIKLEEEMSKKVIGQDAAISSVAQAIRRSRFGISDSKKPIANFCILRTYWIR
jgi:ATP-dependent Clp protease ATP-binding subunit ClpC